MSEPREKPEAWTVTFIAEPGDPRDAAIRMRLLLKHALRQLRLRCSSIGPAAPAGVLSAEKSESRYPSEVSRPTTDTLCDTVTLGPLERRILEAVVDEIDYWTTPARSGDGFGLAHRRSRYAFNVARADARAGIVAYRPCDWFNNAPTPAERQAIVRAVDRLAEAGLVIRLGGESGNRTTHLELLALPLDWREKPDA